MSHIAIIGSGVVGAATGKGFKKKGHRVSFVDVSAKTIERLRAQDLDAMTIDQLDWSSVEILMLTVPTPTPEDKGETDLTYIREAARNVGEGLKRADHFVTVVVRSTVPPTTTERVVGPIVEQASGKKIGRDFGLVMNPEFLRQVHAEQDFARPWITVVGCSDERTAAIMDALYKPFGALISHCTPTEAELIKYVNNVYNAVKISYFNEVHAICQQLGADSNVVGATVARSAESMWNPLYGVRGGVPYGGACLPKDTVSFQHFARQIGMPHLMLDATIEVNKALAHDVPPVASPDQIDEVLSRAEHTKIEDPRQAVAVQQPH
jgi:UDPglucose 6-dehydrogenase